MSKSGPAISLQTDDVGSAASVWLVCSLLHALPASARVVKSHWMSCVSLLIARFHTHEIRMSRYDISFHQNFSSNKRLCFYYTHPDGFDCFSSCIFSSHPFACSYVSLDFLCVFSDRKNPRPGNQDE